MLYLPEELIYFCKRSPKLVCARVMWKDVSFYRVFCCRTGLDILAIGVANTWQVILVGCMV